MRKICPQAQTPRHCPNAAGQQRGPGRAGLLGSLKGHGLGTCRHQALRAQGQVLPRGSGRSDGNTTPDTALGWTRALRPERQGRIGEERKRRRDSRGRGPGAGRGDRLVGRDRGGRRDTGFNTSHCCPDHVRWLV